MKGKKTGGRVVGTPNKIQKENRDMAAALIQDPEYQRTLRERLLAGTLAPAVEVLLWHLTYGKPVERHQVSGDPDAPLVINFVTYAGD